LTHVSFRRCPGAADQRHATPFFRCHRRASSALAGSGLIGSSFTGVVVDANGGVGLYYGGGGEGGAGALGGVDSFTERAEPRAGHRRNR